MSAITHDEWAAALLSAQDVGDPEALTVLELAAISGKGRSATRQRIVKLLANGRAKAVMKRITDSSGRAQMVTAYRLVNPPAAEVPDDRRAPDRMERRPRRH